MDKLIRARVDVRRDEPEAVLQALERLARSDDHLARHAHDLDIQFKRIAQIQAELDDIKRAWARMKSRATTT